MKSTAHRPRPAASTSNAPAKRPPRARERVMFVKDPELEEAKLKRLGGSRSDDFNNVLANQVLSTLWTKHSNDTERKRRVAALAGALPGIGPEGEMGGKLAGPPSPPPRAAPEGDPPAKMGDQRFGGAKGGADT